MPTRTLAAAVMSTALLQLLALGAGPAVLDATDERMPWAIGGVGGAYLLAAAGPLEVEVLKRDLNVRSGRTDVRAILAGPDRQVVADVVLPHAGGAVGDPPGPVHRAVLTTTVEVPGVYALNITTTGDRYGLNVAWALRTNAEAFVVETARGHRDERHEEPIVLLDAERPAEVCFLPRAAAFEIEVEGLPPDVEDLVLSDEKAEPVAVIPARAERSTRIRDYLRLTAGAEPEASARLTVSEAEGRGHEPWCLRVPRGRAFVSIDGVTRWETGDRYPDHAVWSPHRGSWFRFLEYRWLISPYQRTVWAEPGSRGEVAFRVYNNAGGPRTVELHLDCPAPARPDPAPGGRAWLPYALLEAGLGPPPVRELPGRAVAAASPRATAAAGTTAAAALPPELSMDSLTLGARQSQEVVVAFTAPPDGGELACRLRATPVEDRVVTTYATLTVRGGTAPAARPLELPLVLRPYAHENRQLGYLPQQPLDNQPYFDLLDRPFVATSRQLHRLVDGAWATTDIGPAVVRRVPDFAASSWSTVTPKVAFDADNDVYLLARSGRTVALLRSSDGGVTFTAYALPGREDEPRTWDMETFTGHNVPLGPPPVVRLTRTYQDTDSALRWRSTNDLDLFVGVKTAGGGLEMGPPLRLSDRSLGFSMHSGVPSTVVSRGERVHVVWGEATDPAADRAEIPGVPAFIATYDRATGALGAAVFLGFGPPPNDGHNTPSITADGQGYLHVLIGTHGQPFPYLRSLQPNDAYAGWTEPAPTGQGDPRQTYIGLVTGADDALHLVFRQWRSGEEHLDGATWAALAYQRKPAGRDWEPVRVLVAPPLSEYSIYYHRLTVSRAGALFLSYDYWSTMWFYRNDARGGVAAASGRPGSGWGRAVLTSSDGGAVWSLW